MMDYMPIGSKQITFVSYDEKSSEITVHYSTGEIRSFRTISREVYETLLNNPNRYDHLVRITSGMTPQEPNL